MFQGDMTGQHFEAVLPDFILSLRDWNQFKQLNRDFHHVNVLAPKKWNLHLKFYGPLKNLKNILEKIGFIIDFLKSLMGRSI